MTRLAYVFGMVLGLLCFGLKQANAAAVFAQNPCVGSEGYCYVLLPTGPTFTRSFQFNAPGPGRALATFHGTAYCASNTTGRVVIDLTTQIVPTLGADVQAHGPGGLRHVSVLENEGQTTFNFASTRVLAYPNGGTKTVVFKLLRARMDAFTQCYIYNAAFSVTYTP